MYPDSSNFLLSIKTGKFPAILMLNFFPGDLRFPSADTQSGVGGQLPHWNHMHLPGDPTSMWHFRDSGNAATVPSVQAGGRLWVASFLMAISHVHQWIHLKFKMFI